MDESDFMHFVNSFRWNCTILMKTTRLNEDIDQAVRGVCDIRPECIKMQVGVRIFFVTAERENLRFEHINGSNFSFLETWNS